MFYQFLSDFRLLLYDFTRASRRLFILIIVKYKCTMIFMRNNNDRGHLESKRINCYLFFPMIFDSHRRLSFTLNGGN